MSFGNKTKIQFWKVPKENIKEIKTSWTYEVLSIILKNDCKLMEENEIKEWSEG